MMTDTAVVVAAAAEPSDVGPPVQKKIKTTDAFKTPSDVVLPRCDVAYAVDELSLGVGIIGPERANELKEFLMEAIEVDEMLPLYDTVCATLDWKEDEDLKKRLAEANKAELDQIDEQVAAAEEEDNKMELKDAFLRKAHALCRMGDWNAAVAQYDIAYKHCIGAGGRLDVLLTLIRIGLLFRRNDIIDKYISQVRTECNESGDWERRNKLKLYEAFAALKNREWRAAASQLLECAPVFTATEFISFERFIFTAALLAQLELERSVIKTQVIESPEVNQVMANDETLRDFVTSLYGCQYGKFMQSLIPVLERMKKDFWLRVHTPFFARSIRARVYRQFVAPFSSVKVDMMANSFQLPAAFIEEDVAEFIASGKLSCSIDRVSRVILCSSPDVLRDKQMEAMDKGDKLLAKLQELARIVDM